MDSAADQSDPKSEAGDTTVSIIRDTWGIGHASAPNALAAFGAQGWLAASDRIWQMEWDRRRATGRWAEVVGEPGVREDRFFRRLDLATVAKADWEGLSDQAQQMTTAYAAGVNRWLDANLDQLPAEFTSHPEPPERWEPWHCVLVYKVRHLFMGTLFRKLWRAAVLRQVGPEATAAMRADPNLEAPMVPGGGALPAVDYLADVSQVLASASDDLAAIADTDGGSNSWAVHGSRTRSGQPLLAGDPHRGIEFPNVYYQCHIQCPEFNAIGLSFPGVPGFPHFGHNAEVAWCITHGMADDTDVFVEADRDGGEAGDGVTWSTALIDVAGGDPVEVELGQTARGPVVLGERPGPVLAMMWTGLQWSEKVGTDTTFDALWPMLTASSCDDLEAAVRPWVIPVNNLLTADTGGNISLQIRGRVVERSSASRWTPVPGTDAFSWTDCEPVRYEDLPHWRNPDRGFLVTANNRIADAGPYISLDFAGPARHDRIVELLADREQLGVTDMMAVHADVKSLVAPSIVALLTQSEPSTESGAEALALLGTWDFEMSADSAAAAIYAAARRHWANLVETRLGLQRANFGGAGWPDQVSASRMLHDATTAMLRNGTWTVVAGLDSDADLMIALGEIVDAVAVELAERHGGAPSTWRWGDGHVMVSPHPLASARPERRELHPAVDGCPGDGDTVRCGSAAPARGDRAVAASVGRYVFDIADWDRSGWVVPHGVSGVRGSGHDLDQRRAWLDCELLPMAYSATAVAGVSVESFQLKI